jgi:predicted Zn-dependent protease
VSALGVLALGVAGAAVWMTISDEPASESRGVRDGSLESDGSSTADQPTSDRRADSEAILDGCGQSELLAIPGTDISIEPMSLEQERSVGDETRSFVLQQYQISGDGDTQALLEDLLNDMRPANTEIDFTVTLLDSSEVNAFAIPGGDLFFTTAISSLMTEDELAFVMGHEVGHVVCRHLAQQFEREALLTAGLDALLGTEIDTGRLYAEAAATVLNDVADLGFSREDELESDMAALDLLEVASRPLSSGPAALRALQGSEADLEPNEIEVFFSTHPPTSERIEQLEAEIAQR